MKIDKTRLKKSTSEVPIECRSLIDKLRGCSPAELLAELSSIEAWTFGKCELYHWIDILNICDGILEEASFAVGDNPWALKCDLEENSELKRLLVAVLQFTTLLIEQSFSRHLYNSMERLVTLLSSSDMHVVLSVLNLLYMFSKRSNFITRLDSEKRQALLSRLRHLAESWGGRDNGFGLADCCRDLPISHFPASATTLHFEFYPEDAASGTGTGAAAVSAPASSSGQPNSAAAPSTTSNSLAAASSVPRKSGSSPLSVIHIENVDQLNKTPAEIMAELMATHAVPKDKQMVLFTHLRLAHSFSNYRKRLRCVQARLQALSVLVYSNALIDNSHSLLYPGFLEELVELLELASPHLVDIRAAALRTLTSVIHLDRNPHFPKKCGARLNMIIDVTGASSYHGFLPVLVRTCITMLTQPNACPNVEPSLYPLTLATALFSFLYHLGSYEAGGQALVACGMMESLLKVINWPGKELEQVTFVTRAVRVIDLITNIDMQAFQTHGGLTTFINRLEMEVNICRAEQPFEIIPPDQLNAEMEEQATPQSPNMSLDGSMDTEQSGDPPAGAGAGGSSEEGTSSSEKKVGRTDQAEEAALPVYDYSAAKTGKTCLPQRAALMKSMLNFLKKAIQVEDPAFTDSIRRVMEGSLPASLKHIISNAEYYGPSLFLLATDVVTVYVFQEPSLLSSLQDNGLTDVVLHALLVKEVPATREVLGSLPNVFSALCLNARGLAAFTKCNPFPRMFQVLISQTYLPAMRRRRSSEPMGDTAASLGNAMDELMRHQPTLKQPAMAAIVKLLEDLCVLGRDPKYVCWRAQSKQEVSPATPPSSAAGPGGTREGPGSSDEDDEDEEEASSSSHQPQTAVEPTASSSNAVANTEKTPIALLDFIVNVMKLVDAILSNNATEDHCREFVQQNGLVPLLSVLGLPNLPVDYPVTAAAQSVSSVCKSILNLAHEPLVLQEGLRQLDEVLKTLQPLYGARSMGESCSILLQELSSAPSLENAFSTPSATPLLHAMTAAHGYVVMFVFVCRTGQQDIRSISVRNWGSELGLGVLRALSKLYVSLVWESTLLLALCSDDILPPGSDFGKEDIEKLQPLTEPEGALMSALSDLGSNGMTSAMEALSTAEQQQQQSPATNMDVEGAAPGSSGAPSRTTSTAARIAGAHYNTSSTSPTQIKYIKPLLAASSRLGRALAELFGLLVKLSVGSPMRNRRGQPGQNAPPMPNMCARSVATCLNELLARGLNYSTLPVTPIPKLRLTFLICSVGFTSPMLFDEKKYPYHLMLFNFAKMGGQEAFFDTFRWALSGGGTIPLEEGLESPDLPAGTGEFLDAWLVLLEKMVSPRAILDSPHTISNKATTSFKSFDPYSYLSQIHKMAFEAVMLMWGKKPLKTYGARMSESMLAVLRHILRGEKLMQEKQAKDEEAKKTAETTAEGGPSASGLTRRLGEHAPPQINQEHLRSLIDMGFSRDMCEEALSQTSNLEQATDYLLNHPVPRSRSLSQATTMDADMSEDDQMQRAIAISLGESVLAEPTTESATAAPKEDQEVEPEALSKTEIDKLTETALQSCLALLDLLPDTVYRACDLLVTITKRNGERYRDGMLDMLTKEIADKVSFLLSVIHSSKPPHEISYVLLTSPEAAKAAVRIHLFTLLFEGPMQHEMRTPCALALHLSGILPSLMQLLVRGSEILVEAKDPATPKWLAPLLLMLDLLEKVALATQRKEAMHKVSTRIWKWFDLSNGRWTPYNTANNRIISDAYWSGEPLARINCGRRRYAIQFSAMMQVNEASGNKRPVIMGMADTERNETRARRQELGMDMEVDENDGIEAPTVSLEQQLKRNTYILNLSEEKAADIVRACVKLLSIPVDRDALHAAMRICLRLTRDFKLATLFAELGGVQMLLDLTQQSAFTGFLPLCTLLIRHVMEEPYTLSQAMEKVIRSKTLPNIPPIYKELMYMFRTCSAAICRHPEIFRQTAERLLRVDLSLYKPRYEADETRLLLKCLPASTHTQSPMLKKVSQAVVYDLLNALARETDNKDETKTANAIPSEDGLATNTAQRTRTADVSPAADCNITATTAFNAAGPSSAVQLLGNNTAAQPADKAKDDAAAQANREEEKKAPLVPKSCILRLLAEAVRSYSLCAKLITDYHYSRGQSALITEDCSALAFLLDHLLPASENTNDRECPSMTRMLVAALASCTHAYTAQTTLVVEVKNALTRTLQLPESAEKSSQIQALAGLISTMIENCPPSTGAGTGTGSTSATTPSSNPLNPLNNRNQQMGGVNNMVRIMLRRGLVTDLARVVHSLDLSGPNTAATVNAALKPLETLSRIMMQPATGLTGSRHKYPRTKTQTSEGDPLALPVTPTSEATHAQGDDAAEDPDNTDHDVSGATESIEPSSESRAHQENHDLTLDDIMGSMRVRERQGLPSSAFVNQAEGMDVEPREDDLMNDCARDQLFSEQSHIDDDDTSDTGTNQSAEGEDQADNDNESSSSSSSSSSTTAEDEEDDEDEDDDDDNEHPEEIRRDIQMFRDGMIAHGNGEEAGYDGESMEIFPNEQGLLRLSSLDRDNEDILMIQYSEDANSQVVPWSANSFSLNLNLYEDANNGNDNAGAMSNPPAPNHPLLSARHSAESNNARGQRATRQQRRYQFVRVNMRQSQTNPPVILQHLLGPLTTNIPLNASQAIANSFRDSRVVLMDNTLGLFTNGEEDHIDLVGDTSFLFGPSLAVTMDNTPTALNWWIEETKILDAECSADLVYTTAHSLVGKLKRHRDEELHEHQQRVKKQQENDERYMLKREETIRKRIRVNTEVERCVYPSEVDPTYEVIEAPIASEPESPLQNEEAEPASAASQPVVVEVAITSAPTPAETMPVEGVSTENAMTVTEAESTEQRGAGEVPPALDTAEPAVEKTETETPVTEPSAPPPVEVPASVPPAPVPPAPSTTEGDVTAAATTAPSAPVTAVAPEVAAAGEEAASSSAGAAQELPEGVDPSFLAALPDDMREEVIAEQLRLQRLRQQTLDSANSGAGSSVTQVNPEFLAALPPNIQEEVLSQQRLEQQRQAAATANPEDPVDTAAFFQNLNPALRQAILADMEDSQIAALPPDLAAEAQTLRREWESRNRHIQDRFFNQGGANALSTILRTTAGAALRRLSVPGRSGARYSIQTVPQRNVWVDNPRHFPVLLPDRVDQDSLTLSSGNAANVRVCGRPLLDHEALTCLLVLLFLDEPKLNTGRLHRVFRNLCYHYQTREWIIKALLSILERSNESRLADTPPALPSATNEPAGRAKRMSTRASQAKQHTDTNASAANNSVSVSTGGSSRPQASPSWLNVSVDAALGCRANIFHVNRPPSAKRGYDRTSQPATIMMHRQAAPIVCQHALDLLILLAKSFPSYFLPVRPKELEGSGGGGQSAERERVGMETRSRASTSTSGVDSGTVHTAGPSTNAVVNASSTSPGSSAASTSNTLTSASASTSTTASSSSSVTSNNEFWDLLLKLDNMSSSRKGKNLSRSNSNAGGVERSGEAEPCQPTTFEASAFGQLLNMLDCPVVKRSTVLTDKLLRLLSLVSLGLPEMHASVPVPVSVPPMAEKQVRLAVQVLTSKSCSEDGLEDTTALLLNLANCPEPMRDMILRLLLEGAMKLAHTVCEHIAALMRELEALNDRRQRDDNEEAEGRQQRGTVHDRFTNDMVVVTAPTKPKGGADLQLPSMAPLTSKTSSQAFFLRILKVIIQLREAVRTAARKKAASSSSSNNAPAAANQGDSMELDVVGGESRAGSGSSNDTPRTHRPRSLRWGRHGGGTGAVQRPQRTATGAATAAASATGQAEPAADNAPDQNVATGTARISGVASARVPPTPTPTPATQGQDGQQGEERDTLPSVCESEDVPMDTSAPGPAPAPAPDPSSAGGPAARERTDEDDDDEADEEEEGEEVPDADKLLPNLSEQLQLDGLWETLSCCLLQLADTPDHHAVLMLQPAVEAFFLVHASPLSERSSSCNAARSTTSAEPAAMEVGSGSGSASGSGTAGSAARSGQGNAQAQPQTPSRAGAASATPATSAASATPAATSSAVASTSQAEEPSPISLSLETAPAPPVLTPDQQKFLKFAETHRTVLNQILRQSTAPLADGPFAGLVDHVRILDFDVKRRYFRTELDRLDDGLRREELAVHVRRSMVFEDSFRELQRRPVDEWKNRFYIVFEGEEGQDAGGLLREWYVIISREIFNPMYALFTTSPGDRVTYMINSSSHCNPNHLCYFKFVGRVIAKAIYDNKLLECYFTRSFYKHILGIPVKYTDMESEDYSFYQGLVYLMEHMVSALGYDLTFSAEVQEFGVTEIRDLIPNGRNIPVSEENKMDYIRLVCQMKMTGAIRKQLNAFLDGFYDIIPKRLISIFNEQELELLISGLPNVDIEDLKANTEYHKYQPTSLQIQWFWRALRSFDQADRAKFLQFVTGTSKVPLQGFGALEGMNGVQKFQIHRDDRSTDRLPSAHTCFNQLDLPVYETYDKLRSNLLKAIHECSEGFGFA